MPTFPKSHRLKTPQEFQRVFSHQCYAADETLVINGLSPNASPLTSQATGAIGDQAVCGDSTRPARLGLSIGKAVGNAPLRNRWKRLIREAFRRHSGRWPRGWDFVVRPRKGACPTFTTVERSLIALVARLERQGLRRSDRPPSTRRQSPPRQS